MVAMVVPATQVSSVYAISPKNIKIKITDDRSYESNSFKVTDNRICSVDLTRDNSNTEFTGDVNIVVQQKVDNSWTDLVVKTETVGIYNNVSIAIIYSEQYQPSDSYLSLNVGKYRVKGDFLGDSYYDPISTDWYEFEILPDDTVKPDPQPVKTTPQPTTGVTSGNTSKLNAALTTPTVSFALKPVNGITPTGNATFTLQKKSGSKWKAASNKTVKLSNGKASYKLTKANNAGTYRVQTKYSGDSNYSAVTTAWSTVKIAKGKGTLKKKAKVYKKASSKSKKLTTFKKKKKVTITGTSGKYFKVSYKSKGKTKTGYIAKKYVKVKK